MQPRNRDSTRLVLFLAVLLAVLPVTAQERTAPIEVEADHAEMDEGLGTSVYTGNVVVIQGPARLEANKVTIHAPDRTLERMEAEGEPVHYREEPDEGPMIRGEGRHVEYFAEDDRIVLTGDAEVWQGEDRINGAVITFWRDSGRLVAEGDPETGKRVRTFVRSEEDREQ